MDEMQVFSIVARQKAITDELQRLKTNISKDGPDRKTAEYKVKKLRMLELLWGEFHNNHEQIKVHLKADTPYVQGNTYEKVRKAYLELKQTLESIVSTGSEDDFPKNSAGVATGEASATTSSQKQPDEKYEELYRVMRRHSTTAQSLQRLIASLQTAQENWSSTFCSVKLSMLQKYWSELETTHRLIHELVDNVTQVGYNLEEFYKFEEEVQHSLISLTGRLEQSSTLPPTPATNLPIVNTNRQTLKLPKITLPKFDGNYTKWKQYYDLFTELVDKQDIANCQKLFYLKTTLTGEAETLISHFSTSDNNYNAAWQVVKDRYDNPRLLVTAHVQRLLMQPTIQVETAKAIKVLHDTTQECMLSLKGLNIDTNNWDPLLMSVLIKKLDRNTLILWEQSLKQPKALPSLSEFLSFLEQRFQSLEAMGSKVVKTIPDDLNKRSRVALASTNKTNNCWICKQKKHAIFVCPKFLQLSPQERLKTVKSLNRCVNCLLFGHQAPKCKAIHCTKCNKYHHTLLHVTENQQQQSPAIDNRTSLSATISNTKPSKYVLLGTAIVNILNRTNQPVKARALLDSGSQMSFITEKLASKLHLITKHESLEVSGMGNQPIKLSKKIEVCLQSRVTGYQAQIQVFVLNTITTHQPSEFIDINHWKIPQNIKLADSNFNQPQDVDLLIGAELYPELLSVGQIKINNSGPTLQNTLLGWIVMGKTVTNSLSTLFCGIGVNNSSCNLDSLVERFWNLEENLASPSQSIQKPLTKEERQCEEIFLRTTRRSESGRYIVTLPFLNDPQSLGYSREIAVRRFLNLEKRLEKNPEVHRQYIEFMKDYIALKHMEEVKPNDLSHKMPHYFLPHHCVLRPESSSTKLRVVFDGSSKTSTNLSLNQILHTGPALQNDLVSILLRFRTHKYVFTADITKMYRQILVDDFSKRFQRIVWRESTKEPLKTYQLNTVTYGTKPAPYLAIRCLHDLAEKANQQHLLGANIIRRDIYMDDILTGSDNLKTATQMQLELIQLLAQGEFHLRKWCSNIPLLLKGIPKEHCETERIFHDQEEGSIKTLGLTWLPASDQFIIKTNWNEVTKITKRSILSDTAHIFDPLGIVSPVVVLAKIYLQEIWALKLDWDSSLPMEMTTKWKFFRENVLKLNNLRFPRHVIINDAVSIELHAFSDASERAYGAVVYLKSTNSKEEVNIQLVCSKTRVAPVKQQTIPRLELCAAKLLVQLVKIVKESLLIQIKQITYWTDSQIVLSWINTTSPLKTFVANRIASIHDETTKSQWKFVPSEMNPADLLSRGVFPDQLLKSTIWFQGPAFLKKSKSEWPQQPLRKEEEKLLEMKVLKTILLVKSNMNDHFIERINHKNSFKFLQRVTSYTIRFISNLKRATKYRLVDTVPSPQEIKSATVHIVKYIQKTAFEEDLKALIKYGCVSQSSHLNSLAPFLDHRNIIRVGGRLDASHLPYEARHQMILPCSHEITKLLMSELHEENMHAGPQALLSIARQNYWILGGKRLAQSIVSHCMKCFKAKPKSITQLMGNLPPERVQPSRPFMNVGIDFFGPVYIHYRIRGKQSTKAYVSVFICFSTKAIHLELVTDLTTQAFLGALKRFVARRGCPAKIFSDNATNFIGARNELNELNSMVFTKEGQESIQNYCTGRTINWKPIPPRSPHFGGLWEAAVKSAKHHMKRIFSSASLTQEELTTALAQIEAILNSRPLTPMSNDPNDLEAITPGHFLIGAPLTAVVDPESAEAPKLTLVARWKLVTSIHQEFWRRWRYEYLQEIQQRYKWKHPQADIQPGTLVLIKEDNLPPLKWAMGRVLKSITGPDKLTRVVDIKTSSGEIRRSIAKVCPLPTEIQPKQEVKDPSKPTHGEEPSKAKKRARNLRTKVKHPLKGRFLPIQERSNRKRHNPEISSVPTRKMRINPINTILVICLLILSTAFGQTTQRSAVDIQHFETSPGLYFEDIGEAKLITDDWNLFVYFNMTSYWLEFEGIQRSVTQLKARCEEKSNSNNLCKAIIKHLEMRLMESDNLNDVLKFRNGIAIRKRRSPFDFVGTVANTLFGVLDQEYAQYIEDNIQMVHNNENHLLELNKNQTSILESTTNILNKSLSSIKEQFSEVKHQLTITYDSMDRLNETIQRTEILNFVTIYVTQIMDSFQRIQIAILDAISDTHHGRINALLLSPRQLLTELDKIRKIIPSSLILPGYDEHNLPKLYELLRVKARVTSSSILLLVKLPLLNAQMFQLFKLIPLPVQQNTSFIFIQPSTEFLAITPFRDQHFALSNAEYQSCIHLDDRKYLCKQRHPIFNTHSVENRCEIQMLNHNKQLSSHCELKSAKVDRMWIQLHNPNNWIFAFKYEEILSVLCGSEILTTKLKGVGLMKIGADCIIKQPTMTINAHNFYTSNSTAPFLPTINLSLFVQDFHIEPLKDEMYKKEIIIRGEDNLALLKKKISFQKTQQVLPNKMSHHDIHQYSIGYLSFFGVVILATILLLLQRKMTNAHTPHAIQFELRDLNAGEDV